MKKTIPFAMPARTSAENVVPVATAASAGPSDSSDAWVERRAGDFVEEGPAAPASSAGLVLDLAAERSLPEVVALSVAAPALIGWFWGFNVLNRMASRWTR